MPKGPKAKKFGKQSLVDDELDAYDYAEEDASYQRWEETQVKENKLVEQEKEKEKEKPKAAPQPKPKPTPEVKQLPEVKKEDEMIFVKEELEVELEQFDDWEAAMDALDAKISKEEEKKAAMRQQVKFDKSA
jgi:hypothetical protein